MTMTTTCAWCGMHLRGPALLPGRQVAVSHGICPECSRALLERHERVVRAVTVYRGRGSRPACQEDV